MKNRCGQIFDGDEFLPVRNSTLLSTRPKSGREYIYIVPEFMHTYMTKGTVCPPCGSFICLKDSRLRRNSVIMSFFFFPTRKNEIFGVYLCTDNKIQTVNILSKYIHSCVCERLPVLRAGHLFTSKRLKSTTEKRFWLIFLSSQGKKI